MHVHYCDLCGERTGPEPDALMLIAVRDPERRRRQETSFLEEIVGSKKQEERFELCSTCGLSLLVTMKQKKLDLKTGREGAEA